MTPNLNPKIIPLWDGGFSAKNKWYLNPFKFVDTEDLLEEKKRAYVFFLDLLVNRPTEFKTFLVLFLLAYNNLDEEKVSLTSRQNEAVELARFAVVNGEPPVQYVSKQLGIHKSNASRLLKRAGERLEIATFEDLYAVVDSGEQYIHWSPTEREIQAQKARMTRTCAASGMPGCKGVTRGQFALCLPCSQKFGSLREDWIDPRTKQPIDWLLKEARRIDIEIRKEAINLLYQSHIGYADVEALEDVAA